jgi:gas vesicle protein
MREMAKRKYTIRGQKGGEASVHQGMNPMAAGVMGAVAGAAVGATAAVILSDEKTRKKIGDAMRNFSENAPDMMQRGSRKMREFRDKALDTMDLTEKKLDAKHKSYKRIRAEDAKNK